MTIYSIIMQIYSQYIRNDLRINKVCEMFGRGRVCVISPRNKELSFTAPFLLSSSKNMPRFYKLECLVDSNTIWTFCK